MGYLYVVPDNTDCISLFVTYSDAVIIYRVISVYMRTFSHWRNDARTSVEISGTGRFPGGLALLAFQSRSKRPVWT